MPEGIEQRVLNTTKIITKLLTTPANETDLYGNIFS